jgi:alanine dehydrogenase
VLTLEGQNDGSVRVNHAPFIDQLEQMDLIVNGMLQDPNRPLNYLKTNETGRLKQGALIVDVSCDEGMGFPFARPTSFKDPIFAVDQILYYGVDHTPSYLWNSASWEISKALLPYLGTVMSGPSGWERDETLRRAIEIKKGMILNPEILAFQNREAEYPHRTKAIDQRE